MWREQKDVICSLHIAHCCVKRAFYENIDNCPQMERSPNTDSVFAGMTCWGRCFGCSGITGQCADRSSRPGGKLSQRHQPTLHMSACMEPSVERLVRVNIPLCLCRWNVCMCVRSSVCSLGCLSVVVVEPTSSPPHSTQPLTRYLKYLAG